PSRSRTTASSLRYPTRWRTRSKSEIRITKSETNPNLEIPRSKILCLRFAIFCFGVWICFGFRDSDFGFGIHERNPPMLHIGNVKVPVCSGLTRRSFLQVGAAGLVGLNLPDLLRMEAAGAVDESKAEVKNCIMLFLVGSPGHLDTWALKPNAPADIRGPFKPIKTNVPGIAISEHLPRMAKLADKYSLIRSLFHTSSAVHGSGHQWMMTGHGFNNGEPHPHAGSVIARIFGQKSALPPSIIIPNKVGAVGD